MPALKVNAVAPAFGSSSLGGAANMPNPGAVIAALHPIRLHKYAEGYWREVMIKHMEEVNRHLQIGWRYMPTAELVVDMWKVPLADKYMCLNPHALSVDAIREAISGWGYGKNISDARELSGGVLTPAAAFFHYLDGSGADVVTDINRLGLNLSAAKIPALESALAAADVGSSPINIAMLSYNTKQDSWLTWTWLGHISLKIEGVVHKNIDGDLFFSGVARAYNDIYDFNASTHRSELGEAATAGGRYLGGVRRSHIRLSFRVSLLFLYRDDFYDASFMMSNKMQKGHSSGVDGVASILLFSLLPLVPWLVIWLGGGDSLNAVDGPAAFVVLTTSAIVTLIAQSVYCGAIFLKVKFAVSPVFLCISGMLLFLVLMFCIGSSFLWIKVAMDEGAVLFIAAVPYAVFSARVIWELITVVRGLRSRQLDL